MKEYVLRGGEGPARSFGINYQEELNPEQCEVVMAGDGPILVIAGAGSGKTRTVTYRVARLLESGVSPGQILLLTFTNKAAREMLRRVTELGTPASWAEPSTMSVTGSSGSMARRWESIPGSTSSTGTIRRT